MLRYAELLRASLGYSPSMVLPSPETSAMALQLRSRAWRPAPARLLATARTPRQ